MRKTVHKCPDPKTRGGKDLLFFLNFLEIEMIDQVIEGVMAREQVMEEINPENHLVEKYLNNLVTMSPGKNVVLFQDKYLSNNVGRFPNKVAGLFLGKNVTLFPGKNVKQCLASPVKLCQNRLVNYLIT